MKITVNIIYSGKYTDALHFISEMLDKGVVDRIRAQAGNLRYDYFVPVGDDHSILLIDEWESQEAIDRHHQSDMMKEIAELRQKYQLKMKVRRFYDEKEVELNK